MADNRGSGAKVTPEDLANLSEKEQRIKTKIAESMGDGAAANGPARAAKMETLVFPTVRGGAGARGGRGGEGNGRVVAEGEGESEGGVKCDVEGEVKGDIKGDGKGLANGVVKGQANGDVKVNGDMKGQANGDVKLNGDVKGAVKANGAEGDSEIGVSRKGADLGFGHGRAKSSGDMKLNN